MCVKRRNDVADVALNIVDSFLGRLVSTIHLCTLRGENKDSARLKQSADIASRRSRQTRLNVRVQKGFTGGWVAVHGDGTPGFQLPLYSSSDWDKLRGRANYRSICKSNALADRGKLERPDKIFYCARDKGVVNDPGNRMRLVDLIWVHEWD